MYVCFVFAVLNEWNEQAVVRPAVATITATARPLSTPARDVAHSVYTPSYGTVCYYLFRFACLLVPSCVG
jgi:hypothetical protein